MYRLTREIRCAVNVAAEDNRRQMAVLPANSHASFPSQTGFGQYLVVRVTLAGEIDTDSQYLLNIKHIDGVVRSAFGVLEAAVSNVGGGPIGALRELFSRLGGAVGDLARGRVRLDQLMVCLNPFLFLSILAREHPMTRLSQKFEFSASHRLHNPALSEEENLRVFGKCNNPLGHGHNYEFQVTLAGEAGSNGMLIDVPSFERIVAGTVVERFDHRNLNAEIAEFAQTIPTVENIAQVIYKLLEPKLAFPRCRLVSVIVWETPKTWCEYTGA